MIFPAFPEAIWILTVTGILALIASVFVLFSKRNPANLFFVLLGLLVSFWCIFIGLMCSSTIPETRLLFWRLAIYVCTPIPLVILFFSTSFLEIKLPRSIIFLIVAVFLPIQYFSVTETLFKSSYSNQDLILNLGPLAVPYIVYYVTFFTWAILNFYFGYRKASSAEKIKLSYFLTGFILTYIIGVLFNVVFVFFGYNRLIYFGPMSSIFLVGFSAFAITKHELMDIRVAITRSAAYGVVGILLVASFMILNLIQMPIIFLFASNTLLCLFWVLFADRLRSVIQTPIQEKWITGWYDSNKLLNRISQKLVPVIERTEVFNLIADELRSTIKISRIDVKAGESGHKYDDLAQTKEGLVIPLSSSSGLEGLLVLGPKISEDPYDEKDLTLFRILLNQAVLIFDRMKPYEQIKHEFDSAQKKLFETEKMLSRSARLASLGTLTAGVTHEIRNPLAVIQSETDGLVKSEQNKDTLQSFRVLITKHVDRIANIIDKMLYLARSKEAVAKQIDINKLIEQYVVGIVSSKNVDISTQLNPVPNVLAIEDDLHQVLINLTNNAIKAMPDGGSLIIKTTETK
ncbi:MAG: histidine kinase dimerization/phospho-acceptor domain-containing protein, partial [Candidatus Margulisiibacteriota bacterium]